MKIIKLSIIISLLVALGFVINHPTPQLEAITVQPETITVQPEVSMPYPEPVYPAPMPYPEPVITPCPTPVCTVNYDANGNRYGTCVQICFEP